MDKELDSYIRNAFFGFIGMRLCLDELASNIKDTATSLPEQQERALADEAYALVDKALDSLSAAQTHILKLSGLHDVSLFESDNGKSE